MRRVLSVVFRWLHEAAIWLMADVPVNGPSFQFSRTITLGNVIQTAAILIGGLVFAVGLYIGMMGRLDRLEDHVQNIECAIAQHGWLAAQGRCSFVPDGR